jgi:spermidine synthase
MNQTAISSNRNLSLIILFASTLFTSASLMFVVQPMFGKLLLPLLGGSPGVWNTCMVFYQILLFLGYLYAHTLSTHLEQHRQVQIHIGLILISFLALPLALPENSVPPTESNPTWWLIWTLFLSIGLPFFVVSTTAPLLQKWFTHLGHHTSDDPYYLYTASNAGSLLSLLSYPFLIEPSIGLAAQKSLWSGGYVILCLLITGCAVFLWRLPPEQKTESTEANVTIEKLSLYTRLHWLVLALVPSSLLLGLTNFISTDIASVPLLWIIPLTIYLLSFVIVFSKYSDKIHPWMVRLQPFFLIPFLAFAFIDPADLPYWAYLILHTVAFFFAVMVCHGELARLRPHTHYLTTFYLIMSFAGMLGGMFNTFVAPFIFNAVYEYPIMIVAALLLRPGTIGAFNFKLALQAIIPASLLVIVWLIYQVNLAVDSMMWSVELYPATDHFDMFALGLMSMALINFFFRKKTLAYASLTGVIIILSVNLHGLSSNTVYQKRSFFGVFSVRDVWIYDKELAWKETHELYHGTTKHGAQFVAQHLQTMPTMYYSRPGPMGQLFKEFDSQNQNWTIGVVGLGAGALVCYAKPQQHWTMYEIDPLVIKIAQNPEYFHYLPQCGKNLIMKVGDARLSIAQEPNQKFDLLMMDAFSSDSVPTHLLTQEALQLYFAKLKPNGLLAFHITNRHLSLKKVLSNHEQQLKFAALIQEFKPQQEQALIVATDWVVMAKNPASLEPLMKSRLGQWEKMPLYFNLKPWTDDFTNIIEIWK